MDIYTGLVSRNEINRSYFFPLSNHSTPRPIVPSYKPRRQKNGYCCNCVCLVEMAEWRRRMMEQCQYHVIVPCQRSDASNSMPASTSPHAALVVHTAFAKIFRDIYATHVAQNTSTAIFRDTSFNTGSICLFVFQDLMKKGKKRQINNSQDLHTCTHTHNLRTRTHAFILLLKQFRTVQWNANCKTRHVFSLVVCCLVRDRLFTFV